MIPSPQPIPHVLTQARLERLLAQFPALKAAVIGDLALDAYWYADMTRSRLSRETPHFPRPIVREAYAPGAGGNVAQNLVALGVGQVSVFSVIGDDTWGSRLKAELASRAIDVRGLLTHPDRRTVAYIKPILLGYNAQQEDARLDFESTQPLAPESEQALLAALQARLDDERMEFAERTEFAPRTPFALDMVLLADQQELFETLTPGLREGLERLAASHPAVHFLVDSRQRIGQYRRMVIKPNWMEAAAAAFDQAAGGASKTDFDWVELIAVGARLSQQNGLPVFITLGEQGVLVCHRREWRVIPAAPVQPPLDPVGAGDAFIAALAAALSAGASPWEAGAFANLAAGVTVEKLNQTGSATPPEILARYRLALAAAPGAPAPPESGDRAAARLYRL